MLVHENEEILGAASKQLPQGLAQRKYKESPSIWDWEFRKDGLQTLNDFQKLLGDIQWLQHCLKSTGDPEPLSDILKGNSDPSSPRYLTDATLTI